MSFRFWGKHLWFSIHFIALKYPSDPTEEHKKNYKEFFENLKMVLPCSRCREHYTEHLGIKPLTEDVLSSQLNLFFWTVDIHNLVNESLEKKTWSHEEALEFYSDRKNFVTTLNS